MSGQLERLLAQATPGPWMGGSYYDPREASGLGFEVTDGAGDYTLGTKMNEQDARLIALTPALARLLVDAMEVLEPLAGRPDALTDKINALLARFAEVEQQAGGRRDDV